MSNSAKARHIAGLMSDLDKLNSRRSKCLDKMAKLRGELGQLEDELRGLDSDLRVFLGAISSEFRDSIVGEGYWSGDYHVVVAMDAAEFMKGVDKRGELPRKVWDHLWEHPGASAPEVAQALLGSSDPPAAKKIHNAFVTLLRQGAVERAGRGRYLPRLKFVVEDLRGGDERK